MRQTGYKQARFAKKVTYPSHLPLNKDGEIIELIEKRESETEEDFKERKKQAILLLKGEENPNPTKYEVVGSFEVGDKISGNTHTRIFSTDCIEDGFYSNKDSLSYGVSRDGLGFDFNDTIQITSSVDGFFRDYKVTSKPTWIKISQSSPTGVINALNLIVARNRTDDNDRLGEIVLIQEGTGEEIKIKVTQKGRLTEGIPTEYPYVTREDVIDRKDLNIVQVGEQLWTQENFFWGNDLAHLITQEQLDGWCQIHGINYPFKEKDYNDVFKAGYSKENKNKLKSNIEVYYGDTNYDEYQYQIPTYNDFYEFVGFLASKAGATNRQTLNRSVKMTLAKKVLDQTINGYDDVRISYPLDWRNNIDKGTGLTDTLLKTGSDDYAFGAMSLGSLHIDHRVANLDLFDFAALLTREDDETVSAEHVNSMMYSLLGNGYNHNYGWYRQRSQHKAFFPKPIKLLKYRKLNYDWCSDGKEYRKIYKNQNIPKEFSVVPKGFVRGVLFGNSNLSFKQTNDLANDIQSAIGMPNSFIG